MLLISPGLMEGTAMTTMMSMLLHQDSMMGTTYVDMVTASKSLVSLGPTPMAVDHPIASPKDITKHESKD